MIPKSKGQIEELSCSTVEGLTAYAYKIGKLVFVNVERSGSNFTKAWNYYNIVTIAGVTAKKEAYSNFNNQHGKSGSLSISKNSNVITLNYFNESSILAENSWIRGQLVFVCN